MALETLKGVEKIGKFHLVVMDDLKLMYPDKFNESGAMDYKWFEKEIRPNNFIYVRHDVNSVSFTIQNGPVKEAGVNGCQALTLIQTAQIMIKGLNKNFPCLENEETINHLKLAIDAQIRRDEDRIKRCVEGMSKQ